MAYRTLIINADYRPIQTCSWQRAIKLIVEERATCLIPYTNKDGSVKMIHSPSTALPCPAIILCKEQMIISTKQLKLSRRAIYLRDKFTCQYTGKRLANNELSVDHVIPRGRGGKNTWENMVTCDAELNRRKDNRTPQQAGLRLRKRPTKPTWSQLLLNRILLGNNEVWKKWVKDVGLERKIR